MPVLSCSAIDETPAGDLSREKVCGLNVGRGDSTLSSMTTPECKKVSSKAWLKEAEDKYFHGVCE